MRCLFFRSRMKCPDGRIAHQAKDADDPLTAASDSAET